MRRFAADGCIIRPLVIAVAVLPNDCGAHHAGCVRLLLLLPTLVHSSDRLTSRPNIRYSQAPEFICS